VISIREVLTAHVERRPPQMEALLNAPRCDALERASYKSAQGKNFAAANEVGAAAAFLNSLEWPRDRDLGILYTSAINYTRSFGRRVGLGLDIGAMKDRERKFLAASSPYAAPLLSFTFLGSRAFGGSADLHPVYLQFNSGRPIYTGSSVGLAYE
jgi:hypothetical protein